MIPICKLENFKDISELLKPIREIIPTVKIRFIESGISICQQDRSNACMVAIKHTCGVDNTCTCAIDVKDLLEIPALPVTIHFDNNKIVFKQGRRTTKITTVADNYIQDREFPEIKWPHTLISLDGMVMSDIIDIISGREKDEAVFFELKPSELLIKNDSLSGSVSSEVSIESISSITGRSKFGCDYLHNLIRNYKKFDKYELLIGDDAPIVFNMENDNTKLSVILAPRLSNDD